MIGGVCSGIRSTTVRGPTAKAFCQSETDCRSFLQTYIQTIKMRRIQCNHVCALLHVLTLGHPLTWLQHVSSQQLYGTPLA